MSADLKMTPPNGAIQSPLRFFLPIVTSSEAQRQERFRKFRDTLRISLRNVTNAGSGVSPAAYEVLASLFNDLAINATAKGVTGWP